MLALVVRPQVNLQNISPVPFRFDAFFSPNSERALDYGIRLAHLTRASILLLHVFELPEFLWMSAGSQLFARRLPGDEKDLGRSGRQGKGEARESGASSS
jgi:hypothetical protein